MKYFFALIIFMLISSNTAFGKLPNLGIKQDTALLRKNYIFVDISYISPALSTDFRKSNSETVYLGVSAKVNFLSDNCSYYALKAGTNAEFAVWNDIHTKPDRFFSEVSYMTGYLIPTEATLSELSVGLGVVWGNKFGKVIAKGSGSFFSEILYENDRFVTAGIPFELKTKLQSNTFFYGIGLNLFGNLNPKQSIFGLSIVFPIGNPKRADKTARLD